MIQFLLTRIAEDELRNIHALGCPYGTSLGVDDCECGEGARQRAEREAKRCIVGEHDEPMWWRFADATHDELVCRTCSGPVAFPCPTLRALALPYVNHPDYCEDGTQ